MFFLLHNDLKSVGVARILRPIRPTSPTWLAATATPRRRAYGFRKTRRAKRCEGLMACNCYWKSVLSSSTSATPSPARAFSRYAFAEPSRRSTQAERAAKAAIGEWHLLSYDRYDTSPHASIAIPATSSSKPSSQSPGTPMIEIAG